MNIKNQNTQSNLASHQWEFLEYWALTGLFIIGLALSIVSALNLCTLECSETKSYLLFGLPFAYMGLAFFSIATVIQLYSNKYPYFRLLLSVMVVSSLGAEALFIWIQKYQIGSWCPVCLSIAATLAITAAILFIGSIIRHQHLGQPMKITRNIFSSIPIFLFGFFVALVGISKPDPNLLAMNGMKEKIELGNTSSPVEVYFVSDWFCPACKRVEPVINHLAPKIMSQAGFFFIDLAVHPESANYSPYNLDFLVHNKANYFKIREALIQLTKKNKAPDDAAITSAVAPLGEKLKELGYGEIKAGLSFFDEIAEKYKVTSTPTVIILNTKTHEVRHLKGGNEITEANVLDAVKALQKK
jgi:thiol-disulfide isomerase/thioredoxin